MFKYNTHWETPYEIQGNFYHLDPTVEVPVEDTHPDFGQTIQGMLNLTDAECTSLVNSAKWEQIRKYRDKLLVESDWTQGEDVPSVIKNAWVTYRQSLRDITNESSPDNVVWPIKP